MKEFDKELELLIKKKHKTDIKGNFHTDIYSGRTGVCIIPTIEIDYVNKIKYMESGFNMPYYNLEIRFKWIIWLFSIQIKYA